VALASIAASACRCVDGWTRAGLGHWTPRLTCRGRACRQTPNVVDDFTRHCTAIGRAPATFRVHVLQRHGRRFGPFLLDGTRFCQHRWWKSVDRRNRKSP
jgi:hypothetical protein